MMSPMTASNYKFPKLQLKGDLHPCPGSLSHSPKLVFLGGSCGITKWRAQEAIPFLEKNGIPYFNPQKDEWTPDLLLIEDQAKKAAEVLFFVLDNQTRCTAAMIEVAYALGRGQPLVLVIINYSNGCKIAGEQITQRECEDLKRCQRWLRDVARAHNVKVYGDITLALMETVYLIKGGSILLEPKSPMGGCGITASRSSSSLHSLTSHLSHSHSLYRQSSLATRSDRVVFFIIPSTQRALVEMISAAYFVGRKDNCIVSIRELPMDSIIDGERLSPQAVKDYNRGRSYLADLTRDSGIPVFSCIRQAVTLYLTLNK